MLKLEYKPLEWTQKDMKYIVLIGDGMADRPLKDLNGLTPLEYAKTTQMDTIATKGIVGKVRTIPEGFPPGSDVANLSILGYDPSKFYTGRAPFEAASIGVSLEDNDIAYRCNLVTLKDEDGKIFMDDYSSGHITTDEAQFLIQSIIDELSNKEISFYKGVGYRHLMVWHNGNDKIQCFAPHDILDKEITLYLPLGQGQEVLIDLMERSKKIFAEHPINQKRINEGKKPATSIWIWGQGKRPSLPKYKEKYGLSGALISAVDLSKGLGIYAGLKILNVPGATGWIDTNYKGKAEYALKALEEVDFVYVHIESPDEAGHSGNLKHKIKAIEDFDRIVVGTILKEAPKRFKDFKILLMPDHATPIEIKTHSIEPVPFAIYDSRQEVKSKTTQYSEAILNIEGVMDFQDGYKLMDWFLGKRE